MPGKKTRDSILLVAGRLFSRFGFHRTSMDEIAKVARKAKGSLYYHFPSKEDLFREVVSLEFENLKKQLAKVVADESLNVLEKLKKYLILRMEILSQAGNYHETLKADFFEQFVFLDQLRDDLIQWEKQQLKNIVDKGIAEGIIDSHINTQVAIDVFMLTLQSLEVPFFIQNNYSRYAPYFDDLINIILKGLRR